MGLAQEIAAALHAARESIAEARTGVLAAGENLAAARDRLAALTEGSVRDEPVRSMAALEQAGQHVRQAAAAMSTCDSEVAGYTGDVLGFRGVPAPRKP